MTTNDQPSPTQTRPPSALVSTRTSANSATSPGRCLPDPLTDSSRFTLTVGPRPAPKLRRTRGGELNTVALTREWVTWRRIECGGADMGGVHRLTPKGANQTFTPSQVNEYRRWFTHIPRPVQCSLDLEKLGRHAHPMDRLQERFATIGRAFAALKEAGPFG